jgi:hypothetical protein
MRALKHVEVIVACSKVLLAASFHSRAEQNNEALRIVGLLVDI